MDDPRTTNPSGLRDPNRAARGLASIALAFEAVALLMAIVPMRILLEEATVATVAIVVLVVVCIALAAMTRHPWVWPAGAAVQVALIALWPVHWALGAAGLVFAAVWAYCWYVRAQLSRPPKR